MLYIFCGGKYRRRICGWDEKKIRTRKEREKEKDSNRGGGIMEEKRRREE